MADPISTVSGLLAIVGFAFQSSKLLYQAVESFKSNKKTVRNLREELEALGIVLQSLHETTTTATVDLTTLELPLVQCGKACQNFEAIIVKCTAHSGGPRTSFRDWAKLTYMGNDIVGFKDMLAGYKSTITIALADANMRTSAITVKVLMEYKELIANTTSDLEDHLQEFNQKLQAVSLPDARISDEDATEHRRIQEERDSTQQCLSIIAQVSTHIDQVQLNTFENISTPSHTYLGPTAPLSSLTSAQTVTASTLKGCKESLTSGTSLLQIHLQDLNSQLRNLSSQPFNTSNDHVTEREKLQEEIESIKQCLAVCGQASVKAEQNRINFFEDISMSDDGQQVIISTVGDLISAKRVTVGARSTQIMGQMSDDSVQHFSPNRDPATGEKSMEQQIGSTQFEDRYGTGIKLNLQNLKATSGSPRQRGLAE